MTQWTPLPRPSRWRRFRWWVRGLFGPRVTAVRTGYVVVDECGPIVTDKESP